MKKILFVSHSPELNGAELWLLETLKGLDRARYAPVLAVPGPGRLLEEARRAGLNTVQVPLVWWITEKSRRWKQPAAGVLTRRAASRLARWIGANGADLVFSNSAAVAAGALAAKKTGLPHVWSIHEILSGPFSHLFYWRGARRLTDFILGSSCRVIVNSRQTAAAFPPSDKISLVYNGLGPKSFDPFREAGLRREFRVEEGDRVIGVIGKLYEGKGQADVLRAAALLAPEFPRLKVIVVGEARDRSYAAGLRRLAESPELAGRVLFTGFRTDLPDLLKILDALVVASTVESFGRAALDAMACGIPVVAAKAGGLAEIIVDGVNGILADPPGPDALAAGVRRVLSDPALAETLVRNGARTVASRFSLAAQIEGVEAVLDECLGAR